MEKSKIKYFLFSLPPIITFLIIFFYNAVNIPYGDDWSVLHLFTFWDDLSFVEKINAIFKQHNEHRIVFTRILGLVQLKIIGHIDVRWWMLAGNFGYLLIFYIEYQYLKRKDLLELLPILSLLLFAPFSYSNIFNGMQNSNTLFIAFSIALIYSTMFVKRTWVIFVLAFLVMFTNGGGLFTLIVSISILNYRRQYNLSLIFGVYSLCLTIIYFWDFHSILYHPSPVRTLLEFPFRTALFIPFFVGGIGKIPIVIGSMGCMSIALTLYYIFTKKPLPIFIVGVMAFILFIAISAALNRSMFGLGMAYSNRYKIYSQVFISFFIIWNYTNIERSSWKKYFYISVLAISFFLFIDQSFIKKNYLSNKELVVSNFYNWYRTGHFLTDKTTTQIVKSLIEKSIYLVPSDLPESKSKESLLTFNNENSGKIPLSKINFNILEYIKTSDQLLKLTIEEKSGLLSESMFVYLIFKKKGEELPISYYKNSNSYLFNLRLLPTFGTDVPNRLSAIINTSKFKSSEYQVYLKLVNDKILDNDWVLIGTFDQTSRD